MSRLGLPKSSAVRIAWVALVALVVSGTLFLLLHDRVAASGYTSMSIGGFAFVFGLIVAAVGVAWNRKIKYLASVSALFALLVLVGAGTQYGNLSNAPEYLTLGTAFEFSLFMLFTFVLPWGLPIVALLLFTRGDASKLWRG